ncbi:hypothetical protein [Actinomadura soli]
MPSYDTDVPALVLKVGDYALHHGGLAVVRTLGRVGVPVYAVTEDRFTPAALSRYTTGRFVWRTGGQERYQRQLLAGLHEVAERIGRPAVLIPTDDHAALFVSDHAGALKDRFLFARQPPGLVRAVTDKAELQARCRALGSAVPAGTVVERADELAAFAETAAFPVVVKQAAPFLFDDGRRATSTRIVRDRRELLRMEVRSRLLLQEHIPSEHAEDWLFHGYCDASSECLIAFTGRKLRSWPAGAGETAFGRAHTQRHHHDHLLETHRPRTHRRPRDDPGDDPRSAHGGPEGRPVRLAALRRSGLQPPGRPRRGFHDVRGGLSVAASYIHLTLPAD